VESKASTELNNRRKIEALRRLAERPGTEHEGNVAREMLAKLEGQQSKPEAPPPSAEELYRMFQSGIIDRDAVFDGIRRRNEWDRDNPPTHWKCACGSTIAVGDKCGMGWYHQQIQSEIRTKFAKGDRVFYNYHAYEPNCPGTVAGYCKMAPENGSFPWAWIRIKFDHLKSVRAVPIYFEGQCRLTHEPLK
jgi:hypothetical protein